MISVNILKIQFYCENLSPEVVSVSAVGWLERGSPGQSNGRRLTRFVDVCCSTAAANASDGAPAAWCGSMKPTKLVESASMGSKGGR